MTRSEISTYVKVGPGKELCKVVLEGLNPEAIKILEENVRTLLNMGTAFAQSVEEIVTGMLLQDFLVHEKIVENHSKAMKYIVRGSVLRRAPDGTWRIVATKDATVRPGQWKIMRYGIIHVGEDGRVEKRLNSKGGFRRLAYGALNS